MLLEIAVFNIQSAMLAIDAGADRIELCENPSEGGTTPSFGTLKIIKQKSFSVPIFPIIRPRGGDFFYSDEEFEVMKHDVQLCKSLGFEAVVFGLLNEDGTVDKNKTSQLVELAYPLEVTFHRAFDRTADPFSALENIISCGCQRILTSGQMLNAFDGKKLIKRLIEQADDRIVIMPGSGVRSNNIVELATFTGATELHFSARKLQPSSMKYQNKNMQEDLHIFSADAHEIKLMKQLINKK
ncbi:MAG: copper homeostasis protein CutC [Chitinophagaceae bacterium]